MNTNIEVMLFDQPSGNVRGLVNAFATVKGKVKRVAHATLLTDRAAELSLEVPRSISLAEIAVLTAVLGAFASRVIELSSN